MAKKKKSWKNSLFFLLGALIYSFLYWVTDHNFSHVFGIIIIALICDILFRMELKNRLEVKWMNTESVISMCAGAIVDSLYGGVPFGVFH